MNSFMLALSVVLPLVIYMTVGGLIRKFSIFSKDNSPTTVASAPMAQTMGGNGELAGEIVATTSVLYVFTLFFFVFGMSHAGLI